MPNSQPALGKEKAWTHIDKILNERHAAAAKDARAQRGIFSGSPSKPSSYSVAARPGFQRESDKEDEDEESKNDEEHDGWDSDEEEFNPYNYNFDIKASAHVSHEDLKISFAHLPLVPEKTKTGYEI